MLTMTLKGREIMWETKASELFTKAVNDLACNGWKVSRITDLTYQLEDADGVMALGTCYVEQFPGKDRYSIFIKIGDDIFSPCGTVARDENDLFQSYDIEGSLYTAKNVCSRCAGALDKHAIEVDDKAICKNCQTTEDFFF